MLITKSSSVNFYNYVLTIIFFGYCTHGQSATYSFGFLGYDYVLECEEIKIEDYYYIDILPQGIEEFEKEIEHYKWETLLPSLLSLEEKYHLDGFAVSIFLDSLINVVNVGGTPTENTLLKWACLKKMKYDVLLSYSSDDVKLYGHCELDITNKNFTNYQNKKYLYLGFVENSNETFYLHEDLVKWDCTKSFKINPYIKLEEDITDLNINFEHQNKLFNISVSVNKNLINYLQLLPDLGFNKVYVNNFFSQSFYDSLEKELTILLQNMTFIESLEFFLSLTRGYIPHENDHKWLGKEDYMFPEEAIYSSYADCEDKSFLFAFLVDNILNKRTILLYYSSSNTENNYQHANIGVEIPATKISEDMEYIEYDGRVFVICEPTGTGFAVGQNMNKIKGYRKHIYPMY